MLNYLKPAAMMLLLLTLLTGVIYPALVTAVAQVFFADQANGSLIKDQQGQPVGSVLIGQSFSDPKYFWGDRRQLRPMPTTLQRRPAPISDRPIRRLPKPSLPE